MDEDKTAALEKKLAALEQTARPKKISVGWCLLSFLIGFSLALFVFTFLWHWQ
jgi:hypothetical protein